LILNLDFDGEALVVEFPENALGYIDDGWQRSLYDGIPNGKPSKPVFIVAVQSVKSALADFLVHDITWGWTFNNSERMRPVVSSRLIN
jgi:hypothetical protein